MLGEGQLRAAEPTAAVPPMDCCCQPGSTLVRKWGYSGAVLLSREAGVPEPWILYHAEDFPAFSMVAIFRDGHVRGCGVLMPERTPEGDVRI